MRLLLWSDRPQSGEASLEPSACRAASGQGSRPWRNQALPEWAASLAGRPFAPAAAGAHNKGHAMRHASLSATFLLAAAYIAAPIASAQAQAPGPSLALFKHPYYACKTNYYVSATGSDANSGNSVATPWQTLQHANNAMPAGGAAAGTCINVEPGTYAGVQLTRGGNLAASTGYLTYRCTSMGACTVNGTAGVNRNAGFFAAGTGAANYVIIDGFHIVGNSSTYGVGVAFVGASNGIPGTFGSHHDWVLNSTIHGFGEAGVGLGSGDYTYVLHNRIYGNANAPNCDSGAQGSGLADNSALDIAYGYPSYVPTADDKTNPNPLIGSFVTGSTWFHKSYSYNIVHNNYVLPCSGSTTADSDGNNIILDSFGTGNGNVVSYPDQTLIAFNVVFNAGGGGIHIFFSEYATIANNTSFNNHLDPYNTAGGPAIDTMSSYGDTVINNIAVAMPAGNNGTCAFGSLPYPKFNNAIIGSPPSGKATDTFSHNITMLMGGNKSCWGSWGQDVDTGEIAIWNGDTYASSSNKEATDPLWIDVAAKSTGTEVTPPGGANFALKPGSPAIGYGLTETYLPATSVDVGACSSTLATCR